MAKKVSFDEMYADVVGIDSVSDGVFRALGVIPCALNRPDINNYGYFDLCDASISAVRVLDAIDDVDPRSVGDLDALKTSFADAHDELKTRKNRYVRDASVLV